MLFWLGCQFLRGRFFPPPLEGFDNVGLHGGEEYNQFLNPLTLNLYFPEWVLNTPSLIVAYCPDISQASAGSSSGALFGPLWENSRIFCFPEFNIL